MQEQIDRWFALWKSIRGACLLQNACYRLQHLDHAAPRFIATCHSSQFEKVLLTSDVVWNPMRILWCGMYYVYVYCKSRDESGYLKPEGSRVSGFQTRHLAAAYALFCIVMFKHSNLSIRLRTHLALVHWVMCLVYHECDMLYASRAKRQTCTAHMYIWIEFGFCQDVHTLNCLEMERCDIKHTWRYTSRYDAKRCKMQMPAVHPEDMVWSAEKCMLDCQVLFSSYACCVWAASGLLTTGSS